MNTRDIDLGTDVLGEVSTALGWLQGAGLLSRGESLDTEDLDRLRRFREVLREALVANHDGLGIPEQAVRALNDAIRGGEPLVTIEPTGWSIRPRANGITGALGVLALIVMESLTDGSWERLKACSNEECRWAFYDRSRSHARRWCSMSLCGNRAKQRTWRQGRPRTGT